MPGVSAHLCENTRSIDAAPPLPSFRSTTRASATPSHRIARVARREWLEDRWQEWSGFASGY
jgi:hypothetical protein